MLVQGDARSLDLVGSLIRLASFNAACVAYCRCVALHCVAYCRFIDKHCLVLSFVSLIVARVAYWPGSLAAR
jgi:hypothetical protein